MATEYQYQRECDDIDEIKEEERNKHWCYKHSCKYEKEKGCPVCNRIDSEFVHKASLEVEDGE